MKKSSKLSGQSLTLEEVGELYGISKEHQQQLLRLVRRAAKLEGRGATTRKRDKVEAESEPEPTADHDAEATSTDGAEPKRPLSFPLRLSSSVRRQATELAQQEGISLNHFCSLAIAQKIVELESTAWLRSRTRAAPVQPSNADTGTRSRAGRKRLSSVSRRG